MRKTRLLRPALGVALAILLTSAGGLALAQDQGPVEAPDKRIDRLEKQLREVRQIVLQARATGAPVEIKEAGPDPQVIALTSRLDDMDQTLRGMTGQIETLQHDLAAARADAADAKTQDAALADRLTKLEAQVAAMAPAGPPPPPPADGGQSGGDGGLAGQAAQGGGEPPPPSTDPKALYAKADGEMRSGDYDSAVADFQDYVDHFGDTAAARPARYWLGEIKYMRQDYSGSALAYAGAIRGWPQTPWAPDALVKLSLSLAQIKQPKQACGALAEFARRYPDASDASKHRAAAAKDKLGCLR
jgi:tol-pal system protein YbgF